MLGALGYVVLGFVANAHHRGVCPAEPQNQQQAAASVALAALLAAAPIDTTAFAAEALAPGTPGTKLVKGKVVKVADAKPKPKRAEK